MKVEAMNKKEGSLSGTHFEGIKLDATSYGKFDQFPAFFLSLFFLGRISLEMPQTNTSPEKWMDWKTILFFRLSPYFLGLLLLVSGVASKGFSRLRPRLFVGMILILIFAEATEGELKSALNLRIFGGSTAAPKKSLKMFEDLC